MSGFRFKALGTYVVLKTHNPAELDLAIQISRQILAEVDQVASRFRVNSELSSVNRAAGSWAAVSEMFLGFLTGAIKVATDTNGLVTPLVGTQMIRLGYDRTFQDVLKYEPNFSGLNSNPVAAISWEQIQLGVGKVKIPAGSALDLGATGKAFAADLIARAWATELSEPAVISLGGDIATFGSGDWEIGIADTPSSAAENTIRLHTGGLATSSTQARKWQRGGTKLHHILDPRTGATAETNWRYVSVIAGNCLAANAASTAAIILAEDAPKWLTKLGVAARLVADSEEVLVGNWPGRHEID